MFAMTRIVYRVPILQVCSMGMTHLQVILTKYVSFPLMIRFIIITVLHTILQGQSRTHNLTNLFIIRIQII